MQSAVQTASGDEEAPQEERQLMDQQQQQQQQQQQEDLVLRVLLDTNPREPHASELLQPFHSTSGAGRAAALSTVRYLCFNRSHDLPPHHKLEVLAAADQATAFAIRTDQVGGLLAALQQRQQQQQQLQQEEGGVEQELQQMTAGAEVPGTAVSAVGPAAAITATSSSITTKLATLNISSSSTLSRSDTYAPATPSSSSTSSRTTSRVGAATPSALVPAWRATRPGTRLAQGLVVGPMTASNTHHLVQLLDALPCTQSLRQLVLFHPTDGGLERNKWRPVPLKLTWAEDAVEAALGGEGGMVVPGVVTPELHSSSIGQATSSSSGGAGGGASSSTSSTSCLGEARHGSLTPSSSAGASWRTSCTALLVSLYPYLWRNGQRTEKWHGVTKPHLSDLGALLGALPQLRLLYLQEMRVGDFSGYAASLQGLRVLHVQRVEGLCAPGVLSAMLSLSNLRHLGLKHCLLRDQLQWPGTPHVHLTSLDFSGSRVSQGVLKGLLWHCSGLQTLHLSNTRLGPSLPLSISRLTALRSLWMDQSSVRRLPDTITALPGLRHLLWHGKVAMDEFRVVWRLTSLQSLSLGCDGLMVPAAISQLTQLSSLSLAVKWLSELPASLSTLVRLESLVVDTPYVAAIPEGITALTWLRSMSVSPAVLPRLSPAVHEFVSARSHPAP